MSQVFDYIKKIGFLSFFLLAAYITNILGLGFYFGYLLIIFIPLKRNFIKANLDKDFFFILLFSLVYGTFYSLDPASGIQYIFVYSLTPPALYLWGKYLSTKAQNQIQFFYLLVIIGVIFSIPPLISVFLDILKGGFAQGNRSIPMFWSDLPVNATGMAAPFLFNMCIPAILLAYFNRLSLLLKVFLVAIYIMTLMCVIRLGSRTQLVITLLTFLIALIYTVPKQSAKSNVVLIILLALGFYLVFRNVSFDLDSDWLTSFAGRIEQGGAAEVASGGGRTERWVKSIEYIFEKPLGWDVKEFGYSHNLWLDTLRAGSVISLFLLLIISIRNLLKVKKIVLTNTSLNSNNVIIFTYFVSFNLLFFVEPIIDGSFFIFVSFCMFMGLLNKYDTIVESHKEHLKASLNIT